MKDRIAVRTMTLVVGLFGMVSLLPACIPKPRVDDKPIPSHDRTMGWWQVYDRCRTTTHVEERKGHALLLHHAALLWPDEGGRQPVRRSVEIKALAASCNLLAGSAMVQAGEVQEATAVYRLAKLHANTPDLVSLKRQAETTLREIEASLDRERSGTPGRVSGQTEQDSLSSHNP